MMFVEAAGMWTAGTGAIPGVVSFELVPTGDAWMIVSGVLAAVCALLWSLTKGHGAAGAPRKLRIVDPAGGRRPRTPRPQPLHA